MPRGVNTQDEGRIQGRNVVNANSSNIVAPGIVTDGLVLHLDAGNYVSYPASGTTWYDLSGMRNNATLTGPTYVRDGGGALDFDGTNDYAIVSSLNMSQTDKISVCSFLRTTDTANAVFFEHSTNYNNNNAFVITVSPSGNFAGGDRTVSPDAYNVKSTNNSYNNGGWFYVALTMDRSASTSNQTLLYINGAAAATTDVFVLDTSGNFSTFDFYIGARAGSSLFSKADIALVQIYNRALTPAEVSQNFNATRARFNI